MKLSKLKSLAHADNAALFELKFNADNAPRLRSEKVQTNSPTKCSASAQDPPLPATKILLLFSLTSKISLDISSILSTSLFKSEICFDT